jgi:hypothetical protein
VFAAETRRSLRRRSGWVSLIIAFGVEWMRWRWLFGTLRVLKESSAALPCLAMTRRDDSTGDTHCLWTAEPAKYLLEFNAAKNVTFNDFRQLRPSHFLNPSIFSASTFIIAKVSSSNPFSVLGDPQTPSIRNRRKGTLMDHKHTPVEEIKCLPEMDSLATNVVGTINVSPANSASSETEVRVETNFGELMRRMKIEIKEELKQKIHDEIRKSLEASIAFIEFSSYINKYACLRAIESWCIDRMKRIANLPSDTSHNSTVDKFLQEYNVSIQQEYLQSLKLSTSRDIGNSTVHPDPTDDEYATEMWKFLSAVLSEEEWRKYESLMDFGRGYINVSYKTGQ